MKPITLKEVTKTYRKAEALATDSIIDTVLRGLPNVERILWGKKPALVMKVEVVSALLHMITKLFSSGSCPHCQYVDLMDLERYDCHACVWRTVHGRCDGDDPNSYSRLMSAIDAFKSELNSYKLEMDKTKLQLLRTLTDQQQRRANENHKR